MTNIAEILKNAPEGLKLYTPIYGDVELKKDGIVPDYPIRVENKENNYSGTFDKFGKVYDICGECVLFPSKEHRTWDNWQTILIPQCVGTVITSDSERCNMMWIVAKGGMHAIDFKNTEYNVVEKPCKFDCFNFDDTVRFATPKETEECFKELDRQGYKFEDGEVVLKDLENMECKSWSIYDAKDGEILQTFDDETLIFARISDNCAECYVSYNSKTKILSIPKRGVFYFDDFNCIMRPATQEEKNELLKKLDDEGYVWNQEELRLEMKVKEREWTIYDAIDGNFIYDEATGNIFVFEKIIGNRIYRHIVYMVDRDFLATNFGDPYKVYSYLTSGIEHYRLATIEEMGIFFEKLNKMGYCWDVKNKVLKMINERKFTINDFKPFDKVLVRQCDDRNWRVNLFSHVVPGCEDKKVYFCLEYAWMQCVPYNEDTAHLLGTTENYEGPYKTWEE